MDGLGQRVVALRSKPRIAVLGVVHASGAPMPKANQNLYKYYVNIDSKGVISR